MDYDRFDVVIVPFPFTDKAQTKRRPALVVSVNAAFNKRAGHSVLAMITSAHNTPWPLDVPVSDLAAAGLPAPSVVRLKLFTLDQRYVLAKRGRLADRDQKAVSRSLRTVLGF